MRINKYGFTLVELIVVITILAILGTIAFINLQGYSIGARNSKRLSDINNIQKKIAVEMSKGTPLGNLINTIKSNGGLTIDGNTATSIQGTANFQNLKEEGNSFKDPITKGDYVLSYSVGGNGTGAYKFTQISSVNEENNQAIVKGNYYQIQGGDSPSIVKNDSDAFVIDQGINLPYELVAGNGDNSTLFEKLIVYLQDSQLGIDPDLFIKKLVEFNGKLYFTDSNYALYSIDSNSNVIQINDNTFSKPIIFNNKLFYYWEDENYITYLSYTDGITTTNIQMQVIMNSGVIQYYMYNTIYNNKLYFWGNNGTFGTELYSIDTSDNLSVIDINADGDGLAWDGSSFGVYNNKLYFWANEGGSLGDELYSLDISDNLTHITIQTGGSSKPSYTDGFVLFNGNMYFNAINDETIGEELFYIDSSDTLSFIDINVGPDPSSSYGFNVYNNRLYFKGYNATTCWELYYIDTSNNAGFYDLDAGGCGNPRDLYNQANNMYFIGSVSYNNHGYIMDSSNTYIQTPNEYYIYNLIGLFENKLFYANTEEIWTLDYIDSSGNRTSIPNLNLIIPM